MRDRRDICTIVCKIRPIFFYDGNRIARKRTGREQEENRNRKGREQEEKRKRTGREQEENRINILVELVGGKCFGIECKKKEVYWRKVSVNSI